MNGFRHLIPLLFMAGRPKMTQQAATSHMEGEKVRILVIFGNIPLYGQERGNIEVMRVLRQAGYQVRVISNRSLGSLHIQPELDRNGIPWTTAPFGPRMSMQCHLSKWLAMGWGIVLTNGTLLREIIRFRPTHLYTMSPDWMDYTTPILFLTRIPLIYLMGDSPRVSRPVFRLIWKWHAARISTLVTVSDFILNKVRENAFDTTKSRRIYHSPPGMLSDPPNSKPNQVRLLVKYDEDGANKQTESVLRYEPGLLTVAYVGQLAKAKGVHLLVEAALSLLSQGAQIRFLIAGDYSYNNPFAILLKSRVEREKTSGRIQFLGFVTNREDVFRLADLHVCPSLWQEPFGLTVLEAKWAGIPSIIFANGGLAETVVHGHDGWVCESQTATGLEMALRFYLDHPDVRSKQGKAARATVTGNGCFGVKQFCRDWTDVFAITG